MKNLAKMHQIGPIVSPLDLLNLNYSYLLLVWYYNTFYNSFYVMKIFS